MTFSPRTAIVTGSDSGIGRATAVALAAAGMDIGITWHDDKEGAERTAEEVRSHGVRAVVAELDKSDLENAGDVIDRLAEELGGVDVFVNNAGTGDSVPLVDMELDAWRAVVATDLDGAFVCIQRAARRMVAAGNGGRIIAITSVHEHQPRVGSSAYDAAKHGLGGLIKTLALELGRQGITANSVAPGSIDTDIMGGTLTVERKAEMVADLLVRRIGTVDDVAGVINFLLGREGGYLTGVTYDINGGFHIA